MAVIGARPAAQIPFFGRRSRPRARPRPARRSMRLPSAARRARSRVSASGLLLTIVAAAGLAFFYLSQSSHVAATGYEIDALQAHITELRQEQQQLIFEIGQARSPARIEQLARERLGLQPIDQEQVGFAPAPSPSTK